MTVRRVASGAAAKRTGPRVKSAPEATTKPARPSPRQPPARQSSKTRGQASRPNSLPLPAAGIRLYTSDGARKYVTAGERAAFLREAERADRQVRTLCMTLAYAGCRLSEALALTADRIDLAAGALVIESLKKRRTGVYRAVPVPPALLDALDLVHGIREQHARRGKGRGERLWPWSRMTGWRAVHAVMAAAGLDGPQASPKGLGTASAWPRCPPASRSTWCRNGLAMPSSPPPPSMPMPSAPRRKTSPAECGDDGRTRGHRLGERRPLHVLESRWLQDQPVA